MPKTTTCIAIVTLLVALAGDASAQRTRSRMDLGIKAHKITVDGLERKYRKVVPPRARQPMPLVLVLHGGGFGDRGAEHVISYTKFSRLALKERFVVVYPMGVDGNWNDGRGVHHIRTQRENIDDVKFIRRVVDEVASSHPIDRSRVFSTGISNGAFMSHRLAAEASDLITGIAPVVGSASQSVYDNFSPQYPLSLFVIQGDTDPLVPFAGGNVGLKNRQPRGYAVATEKTVARYLAHNGINSKPTVSMMPDNDPDDGTTTERRIYPAGTNGVKVQLYVVKNGGHTWPGARQYLPVKLVGKTSGDFDATEAIWNFFKSCPPRQLSSQ